MKPCPNCKETKEKCACIRNKCVKCNSPVGNITFTVCDKCWDERKQHLMDFMNTSSESKSLYSEIEYLIIRWNNDGTKTAGHLTREIMELINKLKI